MARKSDNKEKSGDNIVDAPSGIEEADVITLEKTAQVSDDQLTLPDFEKLSASDHTVSAGATLPDGTGGVDAEKVRAGRPRMTDEERDASRERKRERDRARHRKGGKAAPSPQDAGDAAIGMARANAMIVVASLDLLAAGISGGEYRAGDDTRAATTEAWAIYLQQSGVELPAWVQVAIVSTVHVAPAFATQTGKGRISGIWAKVRAWWIARRG